MSRTLKLPKLIVIIGATATGKTALAVALARRLNGEIISADSRQVYKGLDLGSGKDLEEYGTVEARVSYHLIDVVNPQSQFDLKRYQTLAYKAIDSVIKRGKVPILVGGSGLYVQAIVDGYCLSDKTKPIMRHASATLAEAQQRLKKADPIFFSKLNPSDQKNKRRLERYLEIMEQSSQVHDDLHAVSKPRYESLVFGIDASLATIRKNIKKRLLSRLKAGMIEEVKRLHEGDVSWQRLESFGLEYKFIAQHLQKKLSKKDMQQKLVIASGQFAKRQLTWFRRWEKQGREVNWMPKKAVVKIEKRISQFLS